MSKKITIFILLLLITTMFIGCDLDNNNQTEIENKTIEEDANKKLVDNNEKDNNNINNNNEKILIKFGDTSFEEQLRKYLTNYYKINKNNGEPIYADELKDIKRLHFGYTGDDGIETYDAVRKYAGNIKSLEDLRWFPNLEELEIVNQQVTDIGPIKNLTNLNRLILSFNFINDIEPLAELENLEVLVLSHNPSLEDINSLIKLDKIIWLSLSQCSIKDINSLKTLINLEDLDLANNKVENISSISNLKKLWFLDLTGNKIKNLEPISNLTNLERLFLNNNNIQDISSLINLGELEMLQINNNPIQDYTPLDKIKVKYLAK